MEIQQNSNSRNLIIPSAIIGISLIIMAFLLGQAITNLSTRGFSVSDETELFGYEGVVYKLGKFTGRVDVLVPGNEGAFFVPIWQMNPGVTEQGSLSKEEQENWNNIAKTVAQYISIARGGPITEE